VGNGPVWIEWSGQEQIVELARDGIGIGGCGRGSREHERGDAERSGVG
jgi:hypothetical protein